MKISNHLTPNHSRYPFLAECAVLDAIEPIRSLLVDFLHLLMLVLLLLVLLAALAVLLLVLLNHNMERCHVLLLTTTTLI